MHRAQGNTLPLSAWTLPTSLMNPKGVPGQVSLAGGKKEMVRTAWSLSRWLLTLLLVSSWDMMNDKERSEKFRTGMVRPRRTFLAFKLVIDSIQSSSRRSWVVIKYGGDVGTTWYTYESISEGFSRHESSPENIISLSFRWNDITKRLNMKGTTAWSLC